MSRFDLEKLRDASGALSGFLGQVGEFLNRSYPAIGRRGSQFEEDEILRDLLPGEGTYVDFGAGEPVQCSNTWAFYERGWRGLLVEPLYWYWPALLHQRPGDYLYDAAVRHYTGVTVLRVQGSVSSVLPGWRIAEQGEILVPCERAQEILARFPKIREECRLCSIDVEGVEVEVLESINWDNFRPEIMVVEYRCYDPQKAGEDMSGDWAPLLVARGYKEVARTGINIIYKRE